MTKTTKTETAAKTVIKKETKSTAKTATKKEAKPTTKAEPKAKETVTTTAMNPPTADSITKQLQLAEEKNKKAQLANDKRLYKRFKCQIDKAYQSMENSYLQTAFALHAIYTHKLYQLDNFKNIYDFAKETYSIARGTCNNFINICEKFGVPNENGNIMELSPTYAQYSVSQLAVMLAFPQELLTKCDKSMSVRELKRMRVEYESGSQAPTDTQAIETTMKAVPSDSADTDSSASTDSPEGTSSEGATKLDISETTDNIIVCEAKTVDELFNLRGIITDTLYDVVEGNNKKNARLELRIVY